MIIVDTPSLLALPTKKFGFSVGSVNLKMPGLFTAQKFAFLPEKSLFLRSQKVRTPMRLRLGSSGQHWTTFLRSKSSF